MVLAAGGYNWLRVKPSLGTEAAAFHLVRSATLELVIGFLVLVVTAVLVVHGMAESNATADTLFDVRDGLASLFALVMVAVVLLSSPGERRLLIGDPVDRGIRPGSDAARARAGALVVQRAGASMS